MFALDVPPTTHLFNWPNFVGDGMFGINKVVALYLGAAVLTVLFFVAGSSKKLVPTGVQNIAEMAIEFVENQVILQTMGPDGLPFLPFLTTIFTYILTINLLG